MSTQQLAPAKPQHVSVHKKGIVLETVRAAAKENEGMASKILLSDLDIDPTGQFSVKGTRLNTDEKAITQLFKLLCINKQFLKKFGAGTDDKTVKHLIDLIKNGLMLSDVKKQFVTLIGDRKSGVVTNIMQGEKDLVSTEFGLNVIEKILSKHPELHIAGYSIDPSKCLTDVSLKTLNYITPVDSRGFEIKGEEFSPGMNIRITPSGGLEKQTYMFRQVCTNGMVALDKATDIKMSSLNEDSLTKFLESVQASANNGFSPFGFGDKLEIAMKTKASFKELMDANRRFTQYSDLKTQEDVNVYFPEFTHEAQRMARKGADYAQQSDRVLSNYATQATVWDVFNKMTDFGSHDYGHNTFFAGMQRNAGAMLCKKEFDIQGLELKYSSN